MKKIQCKEGLDIYKKFLTRMTRISEFLKVAEQVGIDKGDIPDLSQGQHSLKCCLITCKYRHIFHQSGRKGKTSGPGGRAGTLKSTEGFTQSPAPQPQTSAGLNVDFDSVFGNKSSSANNLDAGDLGIGNGTTKNDIHWSQPGEKKLTGGTNWQPKLAPTTTWNPATMVSAFYYTA
ncbi:Phosphatidylinositol-binding clathrin assembly protein [Acipenser ruthenus]|uniref:Phosphatidylinositol-binding clathrin assembly protein n=1 Tax=Acipenser ruthenus TaxID=7906 RepID=A0A444U2I9_ACIRT|nr:Phosphatidylinositol-binding clathrin assembly protein [Acipenser ruthenus]